MSVPDSPETTEATVPVAADPPASPDVASSPASEPDGGPGGQGLQGSTVEGGAPPGPAEARAVGAPMQPAEVQQALGELFPALFGGAAKPLKLRIQVDIQERAPGRFSKQALSAFFRRHTGSTSYLIAITKAAHRFDLDGRPAGEITPEHRQVAQEELARRRDNQQSRRELEDQQRRNRAGLLHDFQTTTLTKANFCALKGVPVDELDGLLERARAEAAERASQAPSPARPTRPMHERAGRGPGARPDRSMPAARGRR